MSEDPWEGLRLEAEFQPHVMNWNGTPFSIEEPARCYKGFDLDAVSLEGYFPDLHDEPWRAKDLPWDEIENLRILQLVGLEKTIFIHVMLADSAPAYPDNLYSSGSGDGWHEGGVVEVGGRRTPIKGIRVEPTDDAIRRKIEAAKRSQEPVTGTGASTAQVGGEPAPTPMIPEATPLDYRGLAEIPGLLSSLKADVARLALRTDAVARAAEVQRADLAEAKLVPEAMAVEMFAQLSNVLAIEEQEIWRAMRAAGGIQKIALAEITKKLGKMSTATLCRRVGEINTKLKLAGLPVCTTRTAPIEYRKSGGYAQEDGDVPPVQLTPVIDDWANDPTNRDRLVRSYLAEEARPDNQQAMRGVYPGIDDEAAEYLRLRK